MLYGQQRVCARSQPDEQLHLDPYDRNEAKSTSAVSVRLLARFGNVVRQKRHSAGLSQEDLADAARLHRTYVGAVERGERNISLLTIVKLAAALKVSVSRLTEGL